ncbi:hypothetical protein LXT21_21080 [Myxococcus sp. K38C18041901]|uniref:hypothetical protein n=1 Tax=Myxococcus guangdongensis TaxID=2906760 RepID=UPI0020A751C0|nr:hypothetical protein [Myxococcus guangdongensis]MCP3061278.1 hypothetical protein [Myxococcus guangdongensis]
MRHAVFVMLLLTVGGCRRKETPRIEKVGPAELTHQRSCEWLDWENNSCRADSVLRAGEVRFEQVTFVDASPGKTRALVGQLRGASSLVDLRTGDTLLRFSPHTSTRAWCGDSRLVVSSPLADFGSSQGFLGTTLEVFGFAKDAAPQRAVLHRGLRAVPRMSCGPGDSLAFIVSGTRGEAPIELYQWSPKEGSKLLDTWAGEIENGDSSDLDISWDSSGQPRWCAWVRPYSVNRCVPPVRPVAR